MSTRRKSHVRVQRFRHDSDTDDDESTRPTKRRLVTTLAEGETPVYNIRLALNTAANIAPNVERYPYGKFSKGGVLGEPSSAGTAPTALAQDQPSVSSLTWPEESFQARMEADQDGVGLDDLGEPSLIAD